MASGTKISPGSGGLLYKVAHFSTGYLNVPPNKHRLYNALGLTFGIVGGRYTMNVLAGAEPDGKVVDKESVPFVLRPLHGVLAYDHFSDDPKERWMKVVDMFIPALTGAMGAGMGSDMFFNHSQNNSLKTIKAAFDANKVSGLAGAEQQALFHQGRVWGDFSKVSSVFGSASGFGLSPSPINYSSTLGAKFRMDGEGAAVMPWLGKTLRASLLNNHSLEPFRPTKLIDSTIKHLAGNPAELPANAIETIEGALKTWFRDVTPQQMDAFKDAMLKTRDQVMRRAKAEGKTLAAVETEVKQFLNKTYGMENGGLEQQLIKAGIDPRSAALGDNGILTTFSRWAGDITGRGTTQKLKKIQSNMIGQMETRHPDLKRIFGEANPADLEYSTTAAKLTMAGFIGTGAAIVGAVASAKDATMADLEKDKGATAKKPQSAVDLLATPPAGTDGATESSKPLGNSSFASRVGTRKHTVHSKKEHNFVNGKVLDATEGITGMFNAAIGMHRVHCAVGLWMGSWLGDEVMKSLTGVGFWGNEIKKSEVWKPLQKLHKTLAYNPHSDLPKDKWMQILRWGVPGIVGGLAVVESSKIFFEDRNQKLKTARYLDEVEDKATMAQSQPWSYTSAISSLMGYPTGIPMLPLVNYSTNLGTRFSMASGRKVAAPVLGKWWSNNDTLFPFGPPGMINMLIKEAVNNKAHDPELLETYAIGILKPWFENVTPEQVEKFVMKVHESRDHFLKEGGVPEDMKKQLEAELNAHLHGAGLHETLKEIGLDPLKAHIANNGMSGTIANLLGARKDVERITRDYIKTHSERVLQSPASNSLSI